MSYDQSTEHPMTFSEYYKPHQASEKLLSRDPKYGYVGCRFSADWAATGIATNGESAQGRNGRFKKEQGRRNDLAEAWDAAGRGRHGYNQGHVDEIHAAMFRGLPQPIKAVTTDFNDDVVAHIGISPSRGDHAISIALDLGALPASSPLRQRTGPVGHQVVIWKKRWIGGKLEFRVLDGMTPYSESDTGYWCPRRDIAKAAKAIEEGLVVFEIYPVEGWTQENLARKAKNQVIAGDQETIDRLRERVATLRAAAVAREDEFDETTLELQGELDEALEAASVNREDVLNEGIQALEVLK